MDGQLDKRKKTNFEVLMSSQTPEQFIRLYEEYFGCGCMQRMAQKRGADVSVWKKHCLLPEYRGEGGCDRCKKEFWKQVYVD